METLILVVSFLIAITIHEAAHAWMSFRLGDPTAKLQGRLSLNPMAHIDLVGTVLVPLFLIFARSPLIFGWAKPVQFDPYNLRNPRKDSALISLAGPASNFLLAILLSFVLRLFLLVNPSESFFLTLLIATIDVNVVLGLFNLIPIHPLDGGKIFVGLLPQDEAYEADKFLNRYGMIVLLFLVFPILGPRAPISYFLYPLRQLILNILLPK